MSLPPHDPLLNARRAAAGRHPAAAPGRRSRQRHRHLDDDLGAPRAERVIGIEPLDEMRTIAEAAARLRT